jgi:predicted DNA-binding protein
MTCTKLNRAKTAITAKILAVVSFRRMSKEKEAKIVAIRVELSDELRNRFKSVVVREGKTMTDVVTDLISQYTEEKEKSIGE